MPDKKAKKKKIVIMEPNEHIVADKTKVYVSAGYISVYYFYSLKLILYSHSVNQFSLEFAKVWIWG